MAGKLTARTVASAKPGRHGDGDGLWLIVSNSGAKKLAYRFSFAGKVTEMGLGAVEVVSLAEARDKAIEARKLVAAGKNPIAEKREAKKVKAEKPDFGTMADELIAAKSPEWRNEKHRYQWSQTLGDACCGAIRSKPVEEIDTEAVLSVLQPVWLKKPETASRLRGRIEAVLDFARVKGHIPRNEANPARWRGHLDKLLSKPKKLTRGHHAAIPYAQIPAFMARLREREAGAATALELAILTGGRTREILEAEWGEFDLKDKIWHAPAEHMKAGELHIVPRSTRAMEILEKLAKTKTGKLVFPGQKADKPLSQMAMLMLLRRMGFRIGEATVHGMRSTFRDWVGDETPYPRELAEMALAHKVGNSVERAYRRSNALEKRRALMEDWARYCEPSDASNVVQLAPARS